MAIQTYLKPVATEKAVMKIEMENTMTFRSDKTIPRDKIKEEVEKMFGVKVEKVRTIIRDNKKISYVKLKSEFPAIDIATKLGMI